MMIKSDRDLYLRIRIELRRLTQGVSRNEAMDAIMDHIRERHRGADECEKPIGPTLH